MPLQSSASRAPSSAIARGFTLIELLAVMLIITILVAALTPIINGAIEAARVQACQGNLREIHEGFQLYELKYDRAPSEGGVKLIAALIAEGAIENTKTNAKRLTCPAIETSSLPGIAGLEPEEWYGDLARVGGKCSAYAGRDLEHFPLRHRLSSASGKEPLVCDDNDGGLNHRTTTNVLYADGSVQTFELLELRAQGKLEKDAAN